MGARADTKTSVKIPPGGSSLADERNEMLTPSIRDTMRAEYVVETGVHGAHRIVQKSYPNAGAACAAAQRWARSNSTRNYWAVVSYRHEGERNMEQIATFNLRNSCPTT